MFTGATPRRASPGAGRGAGWPELVVPLASGLIAGESIVGVVVAAVNNFVLK